MRTSPILATNDRLFADQVFRLLGKYLHVVFAFIINKQISKIILNINSIKIFLFLQRCSKNRIFERPSKPLPDDIYSARRKSRHTSPMYFVWASGSDLRLFDDISVDKFVEKKTQFKNGICCKKLSPVTRKLAQNGFYSAIACQKNSK